MQWCHLFSRLFILISGFMVTQREPTWLNVICKFKSTYEKSALNDLYCTHLGLKCVVLVLHNMKCLVPLCHMSLVLFIMKPRSFNLFLGQNKRKPQCFMRPNLPITTHRCLSESDPFYCLDKLKRRTSSEFLQIKSKLYSILLCLL